jgi:glucosamine--fructose-6-phosphate aminotransferase (isomerizing)
MCGIVGYIGQREAVPLLIDGLKRLEYRGYDSAGVAVLNGGGIQIQRRKGRLHGLQDILATEPLEGKMGIGHTRWATHGIPCDRNSHPHSDCGNRIAVVHNGIIENWQELKKDLENKGHCFTSDTDTEILPHLIEQYNTGDLVEGVRSALKMVEGSYAMVALSQDHPGMLVAARHQSPLVVGIGARGEIFLASDVPAILPMTKDVIHLDDQDIVIVEDDRVSFLTLDGRPIVKQMTRIKWDAAMADLGGYRHYMEKEICEQPVAVRETMENLIDFGRRAMKIPLADLQKCLNQGIDKLFIIACGTSYHAAQVGKFIIEGLSSMPVEVDLGSEFRYRPPLLSSGTPVVTISQSGETADTFGAANEARERGASIFTICNVTGSSLARMSDGVFYTEAGPEIGVASTKAFTTQLASLICLGLHLADRQGMLTDRETTDLIGGLMKIPHEMEAIISIWNDIEDVARAFYRADNFLYLGRGPNYPIALEGALKLKEISFIHAEGYPAGEMKHGPIALIDENMPVVCVATAGRTLEKMWSNMEEVRSRGGRIIAVGNEGDETTRRIAEVFIPVPRTEEYLSPLLNVLPLQMLAYSIAVRRGTDVDKPRNLAKSVTVE